MRLKRSQAKLSNVMAVLPPFSYCANHHSKRQMKDKPYAFSLNLTTNFKPEIVGVRAVT